MRLQDFNNEYEPRPEQRLFCWTINVRAKAMSRLSPFRLEDMTISFPVLDVAIANLRHIALQAIGTCGQVIAFTVDIAVFADNEAESMKVILNPTIVQIAHEDAQLLLIDPEISISGECVLPEGFLR